MLPSPRKVPTHKRWHPRCGGPITIALCGKALTRRVKQPAPNHGPIPDIMEPPAAPAIVEPPPAPAIPEEPPAEPSLFGTRHPPALASVMGRLATEVKEKQAPHTRSTLHYVRAPNIILSDAGQEHRSVVLPSRKPTAVHLDSEHVLAQRLAGLGALAAPLRAAPAGFLGESNSDAETSSDECEPDMAVMPEHRAAVPPRLRDTSVEVNPVWVQMGARYGSDRDRRAEATVLHPPPPVSPAPSAPCASWQ